MLNRDEWVVPLFYSSKPRFTHRISNLSHRYSLTNASAVALWCRPSCVSVETSQQCDWGITVAAMTGHSRRRAGTVVTVRLCWATDTITDCTSSRSHFHSIQYSPICSVRDKFSVSWVDFPCCGSDLGPRRQRALLRHNVTRSKHRTGYKHHSYHACGSSTTRSYLFSTTDVRFVKHFVMRQLSAAFIRFYANSYLTPSRMVW